MPTSHPHQLNQIVELIMLTDPHSLLDVGIGFGKYGVLAREYLELYGEKTKEYGKWTRVIDGIEAFPEYITPIHRFIYNDIYIGNALEIISGLEKNYDLVLLIDVIEHFEYRDGIELIEEILKKSRNVIISTPKGEYPQGELFGNPYETHRSVWKKEDFKRFKNCFFLPNEYSIICYIGEDAKRIRWILRKEKIKKVIKNYFPFLIPVYRVFKNYLKRSHALQR